MLVWGDDGTSGTVKMVIFIAIFVLCDQILGGPPLPLPALPEDKVKKAVGSMARCCATIFAADGGLFAE